VICASLGRVELHLGRRMPRAELLWPVHYLAYVQRGRTVRDGAGFYRVLENSTDTGNSF